MITTLFIIIGVILIYIIICAAMTGKKNDLLREKAFEEYLKERKNSK